MNPPTVTSGMTNTLRLLLHVKLVLTQLRSQGAKRRRRGKTRKPWETRLETLLDSRMRTTTSTRFDLKFFAYYQKIDTPEFFIVLFFPPEK